MLSPFTALGNLLGIEASELEQVDFVDGRSDLTPPELEKAAKLAEALALRPELQLTIGGVWDPVADALALRTARVDAMLDEKITELSAASGADAQYADLRRIALQKLFGEQYSGEDPDAQLKSLRARFTSMVEVEGKTEPVERLDELAYANDLRLQLIEMQEVGEAELSALASARAEALKNALIQAPMPNSIVPATRCCIRCAPSCRASQRANLFVPSAISRSQGRPDRVTIKPSSSNWGAMGPASGATNCGRNANKKSAVLGLVTSTTRLSRKTAHRDLCPQRLRRDSGPRQSRLPATESEINQVYGVGQPDQGVQWRGMLNSAESTSTVATT